ncbi:hypothetical protein H0H92_005542 [Tricholoma furcatifolium]|nr:hypothetical protein H0H92_005542 [Tricholoma furcatifolium]
MNTEGRPIISVSDSSKYIKEVAALHGIKSNRWKKNCRDDDSDEDEDEDTDTDTNEDKAEAPLIRGQIRVKKSKDAKKSRSKSRKGKSKATMRSNESKESRPASCLPLHDDAPREKGTKKKSKININIRSESNDEEVTPTPRPKNCCAPDAQSQPLEWNKKSRPHPAKIEAYLNTWALARGFQPPQSGEQHTLWSDGITHVALNDPFED